MKTKEEIETIKKELSKEDFLALNQTERDVYLNKDKKQPQNDAQKQIKGAGNQTQNLARNLRDPDAVNQKLSGIKSKHKLKQLKLTKKGKNKYQIVGQAEATKVQRQVDSVVNQGELPLGGLGGLMVQRSGESAWKS